MSKTVWYIVIAVLLLFAFSSFKSKTSDTDTNTDTDTDNDYITGGGNTNDIRYDGYGSGLISTPTRTDPNATPTGTTTQQGETRTSDRVSGTTTTQTTPSTSTRVTTTTPEVNPELLDPSIIDFSEQPTFINPPIGFGDVLRFQDSNINNSQYTFL